MPDGLPDDLIDANRRHAAGFTGAGRTAPPARRLAVLTCMDARVDPSAAFGLEVGEANVLRNAGGRATPDVLRSLALATRLLGVEQVVVLHHTDCALAGVGEEDVRSRVVGAGAAEAEQWEFLAMPDPDTALRADVAAVRSCRLLPDDLEVVGWRYDVDTGRVSTPVPPERR